MPRLPRTAAADEAGGLRPEYLKEELPEYLKEELSGDAAPLADQARGAIRFIRAIEGRDYRGKLDVQYPKGPAVPDASPETLKRRQAAQTLTPFYGADFRTPDSSAALVVNELSVSKRRAPHFIPRASGVKSAGEVLLSFVSAVPLAYCSPLTRSQPDGTRMGFWPSTASGFAWLMSQARATVSLYAHCRTRRGARKYYASKPPQAAITPMNGLATRERRRLLGAAWNEAQISPHLLRSSRSL